MPEFVPFFSFMGLIVWGLYSVFAAVKRKQQNAIQKHLLDKFSSASDLSQFLQSPAGQKYAASFSDTVTSPHSSVLSSVRLGIILIFAGFAFMVIRPAWPQQLNTMRATGVVGIMLGIGFLVSAAVSWFIAKRLNSEQAN